MMYLMCELLKVENCKVLDQVENWQESIDIALDPLIQQNYCTEIYKDAVYDSISKYGPYFVLCENLALIHATNKKGVYKTQITVTVLKKPVRFSEDGYDVRVLIGLVAIDSISHIEVIKAISNIFETQDKIDILLKSNSSLEIYNYLIKSAKG